MRQEAATALGCMFAPEAARRLAAILTDESPRPSLRLPKATRIGVCRSLGRARVTEAERPLTELLARDPSPAVRAAAAHALGILGRAGADAALITAREDGETRVVAAVNLALSRLSRAR